MDELFHIPQAREMCDAFREWRLPVYHPDITTLPGLYLYTATLYKLTGFEQACSPRWLRAMSAIMALLCLPLLVSIIHQLRLRRFRLLDLSEELEMENDAHWEWLMAFVIWLQPVSFFYANLYYTDTSSTFWILVAWYYSLQLESWPSAIAGLSASITRQTNVVWHAFLVVDIITEETVRTFKERTPTVRNVFMQVGEMIYKHPAHAAVGSVYIVGVLMNGGVVVGDRNRHEKDMHYAMFAYFMAFHALSYLMFQVWKWDETWKTLKKGLRFDRLMQLVAIMGVMTAIVVATGDEVHPFILADNRHYTFYFYRRWLLKSEWHRLALVPLYALGLWSLLLESCAIDRAENEEETSAEEKVQKHLQRMRRRWERATDVTLLICSFVSVVPSALLEPRYFVVGNLFMTLQRAARLERGSKKVGWIMALVLITVNVLLMYVFAEMKFNRISDKHMPDDTSPGRFMF